MSTIVSLHEERHSTDETFALDDDSGKTYNYLKYFWT